MGAGGRVGVSGQTLADSRGKAHVSPAEVESAGLAAQLGKRVRQQPENQQHGGEEEPSRAWRGVFEG